MTLLPGTLVVSGGARGVDRAAEEAARSRPDLPTPLVFRPDYKRYGRYRAPHVRNALIVEHADYIVAFWYAKSGGTESTLKLAAQAGKPSYVYEIAA